MKYLARVNGQTFEITIGKDGRIEVGDQPFSVDMQAIDDQALFSLLIDHESYELVVDEHRDGFRVLLCGEMYEVTVEDGQPHRTKAKRPRPVVSPDGECVVRASLPGLVTQVLVSVGQEVSAGETLVILESMKMENEMLASRQGTVEKVYVAAGDTLNLDDPLITLC